ncbi:hypothetical protein STSP_61480 [Streptomyces jeddahensis]|uniref:Uncharacterized protein n=1 Tax=Streptomyces jeddahensis TaxID=1716141 RepID=A0A177HHT3_9ACTN|nr:hypothetical protein STSP_61480 [Streptomyces jeddahensis]
MALGPEGVHFAQGVYAADFPWPHLQTVQFRPMGAYLCVAAVLLDGRMFECRVKARRTSVLQTWCAELGGVLHHYLSARPR